jgi:Gpi18-like mannosyltransferase
MRIVDSSLVMMGRATVRVGDFIKRHPIYTVVVAALLFIIFVAVASLYSNAVVWNLGTAQGLAVGRGGTPSIMQTFVQYDGFQYTHIAQYGYTNSSYTAFLPFYPILVRTVAHVLPVSVGWAALLVSWASLCGAAIVVYKWVTFETVRRGTKISPWVTLGLIAIFPTAFYLSLPYTESLFILLNVSALLLYRKRLYLWAGLVAALAGATRFQGVLLLAFFAFDFLFDGERKDYKKLIPIVLGSLGMVAYMAYLGVHFGNPLEFLVAEKGWGRLHGNLILNLIYSMRPLYLWFMPVLAMGLWSIWKYLGKSYFWYSLLFTLLPLSSGKLDSINRYMLSLTPMFLGFAMLAQNKAPKQLRLLYIVSSAFLLAWSILLFANGYWVA